MRLVLAAAAMACITFQAEANDWERFYQAAPYQSTPVRHADAPPEVIPEQGNHLETVNAMWRRGFAPIGISSFNSPRPNTADAIRFAAKLSARYVMIGNNLQSSRTVDMPMTTPTTTTRTTNGNADVTGIGGTATGTFNATTTTSGTRTTYMPITVNRYDKVAVYFVPVAKVGLGIRWHLDTPEEAAPYGTRHALTVMSIRDGSPADAANMMESDVVLQIDDLPASLDAYAAAVGTHRPIKLRFVRKGEAQDVTINPYEG